MPKPVYRFASVCADSPFLAVSQGTLRLAAFHKDQKGSAAEARFCIYFHRLDQTCEWKSSAAM